MKALGAVEVIATGEGDQDEDNVELQFSAWVNDLKNCLLGPTRRPEMALESKLKTELPQVTDSLVIEELSSDSDEFDAADDKENIESLIDLEDAAGKPNTVEVTPVLRKKGVVRKKGFQQRAAKQPSSLPNSDKNSTAKEMVTPTLRASLEKQVVEDILVSGA
ncbi:unnamed protein product [Calypogeia fissa]